MNSRTTPYFMTATITNAGTASQNSALTTVDPSLTGKLLRLTCKLNSGASTVATITLFDTASGTVYSKWTAYPIAIGTDIDIVDIPVAWSVSGVGNLRVEITTDDATNTSNVTFDVIGEAT